MWSFTIEKRVKNNILISNDVIIKKCSTGCQYKNNEKKPNTEGIKRPLDVTNIKGEGTNVKPSKQVSFKEEWAQGHAHSFETIQIDK